MPKREAKTLATNNGQTEMTLQLWYRKLIFVFLFLYAVEHNGRRNLSVTQRG